MRTFLIITALLLGGCRKYEKLLNLDFEDQPPPQQTKPTEEVNCCAVDQSIGRTLFCLDLKKAGGRIETEEVIYQSVCKEGQRE